ncbi:hypothetical protein ACFL5V_06585 [Fibrobacterota bacterium]
MKTAQANGCIHYWNMLIDAKKTCRMIGGFVITIGLILVMGGYVVTGVSSLGLSRYEKTSGKLVRMVSSEDRANFTKLKMVIGFGQVLKILGVFAGLFGLTVLIRPQLLFSSLNRIGITDESPKKGASP